MEIELLAAGLLRRTDDGQGAVVLRVTDAGIAALAAAMHGHRAAYAGHATLEALVARDMQRAGRVVWRGLSLRAQLPLAHGPEAPQPHDLGARLGQLPDADPAFAVSSAGAPDTLSPDGRAHRWCLAKPDVYSIRNTTVAEYVHPVVHEVKVRRADLLGDLKKPDKRAAYLDMASECWYVLGCDGRGRAIADPSEIPLECGVMVEVAGRLQVARTAPRRAMVLPFHLWMALAKATPLPRDLDDVQAALAPCHERLGS